MYVKLTFRNCNPYENDLKNKKLKEDMIKNKPFIVFMLKMCS